MGILPVYMNSDKKQKKHWKTPESVLRSAWDVRQGKGKPLSEALKLTNKAVTEALDGLPPQKLHCSVLAEEAIKKAVKDYYDKQGIAYDHALFRECDDCAHCGKTCGP